MIFFCIPGPDDQNRWNRKNCTKFFHRVIFAFWIQICNPNLCKSHIFWITANIEMWSFFAYPDLMTKIDEIEKIANKFFHRVIFAFWIQICNPNLCKSHFFKLIPGPDDQNRWNQENCPKLFHRVLFAFWFKSATQIYVSPIYFELQLILRNDLFLHTWTWWPKSMKSEKLPEILS